MCAGSHAQVPFNGRERNPGPEPDHMCLSRIQRTEGSANWQERGDHLASFTQVAEVNNWRNVGKLSSEGGPLLCP